MKPLCLRVLDCGYLSTKKTVAGVQIRLKRLVVEVDLLPLFPIFYRKK